MMVRRANAIPVGGTRGAGTVLTMSMPKFSTHPAYTEITSSERAKNRALSKSDRASNRRIQTT
jgi:hypothetical protein